MATGNHLLVPVKANQPTLFQHLTETYLAQPPQDRHHTHEMVVPQEFLPRAVELKRLLSGGIHG